jgi:hypothetical protein
VDSPGQAPFLAIPTSDVAATVYVPEGTNVRVHAGMLAVSGDGLGGPDDVLIVAGLLVVTSPVTGPLPRRIHVAGGLLAPRGSEAALGAAMTGSTGGVSYYKYAEGQDVRMLSGEVRLSGTALENQAGKPEDILLVAGEVVITGQVRTVGYSLVIIAGELAAPEHSRGVLETKLQVNGELAWYPGSEARVFHGKTQLGAGFSGSWTSPRRCRLFRRLRPPATRSSRPNAPPLSRRLSGSCRNRSGSCWPCPLAAG